MPDTVARGHLRIYFGYAPGVGKTYQMLEEARALKARGVDLVIGNLADQGRADIVNLVEGLDRISPARMAYRGGVAEEMDVDAILRRRPRVCVVDQLAHSNVAC